MTGENDYFRWLCSDAAAALLKDTQQKLEDKASILKLVKRLRKDISPEEAALVVELAKLRIKARKKFELADQMFFSGRSLEMATDQRIAEFKAKRFTGFESIADICCGIGGDMIGFSNKLPDCKLCGFDTNEVVVEYCNKNLGCYDHRPTAKAGNFQDIELVNFDAIHIDPERRKHGGRSTHGKLFSPTLDEIVTRTAGKSVAIKVAPATRMHDAYPEITERQWIGHSRECKQQVVWTGDLALRPGCRSAVRMNRFDRTRDSENTDDVTEFYCNEAEANEAIVPIADSVGNYIYEPHNVVLAAGLTNALFRELGLERVSTEAAYATHDSQIDTKLVSRFRVLDWMPANLRHVSAALNKLDIGELDVKQRNIPEFVVENYRKIKLTGSEKGCLILSPFRNQRIAIISKRESNV